MNLQVNEKLRLTGRLLTAGVFAFMGLYKVLNWAAACCWPLVIALDW